MLPAYQVWSQPVFALVEGWLKGKERAPEYLKVRPCCTTARCGFVLQEQREERKGGERVGCCPAPTAPCTQRQAPVCPACGWRPWRLTLCPPARPAASPFEQGLAFRLCFRSTYVLLLTLWAIAMPFFSTIIGFVGASG